MQGYLWWYLCQNTLDDTASYNVVKNWVAEFKYGKSSIVNEHRPGRLKDAASSQNIQIVNDMFNKDRRLTIRYIAETSTTHVSK